MSQPMNYAAMLKKAEQKQVTALQKPLVVPRTITRTRRLVPVPNAPKKSSFSSQFNGNESDDENYGPVRRLDHFFREEYSVSHPEDAGKY